MVSNNKKLSIAFYWHMHQPVYQLSNDGEFLMPWVRLHGIRDYYNMIALANNFKNLKLNFNFVPILLKALIAYSEGAHDIHSKLSNNEYYITDVGALERLESFLTPGSVAVVAGFQGITEYGDLTTLGRGGSDLTAVIMARELGQKVCEKYTDEDGVYTADPRVIPSARKVWHLNYDEMLMLAKFGNGILKDGEPESHRVWIGVANENDGRAVLPFESMKNLDAILKSIYRMIKKVKLLEWITAEEAEKKAQEKQDAEVGNDVSGYYETAQRQNCFVIETKNYSGRISGFGLAVKRC